VSPRARVLGVRRVLVASLALACLPSLVGAVAQVRWARRGPADVPAGVLVERELAYGSHVRQRFDIYRPARRVVDAPVIFMVHGGAWRLGDKSMNTVIEHKVARWVPRGVLLVSANYRLLPEADALAQADDIALALARSQQEVARFGGGRTRFVLMGHSAGAHLVALLAAGPERALRVGASPWLGCVALDSAALDVIEILARPHPGFYDRAFGSDPQRWRAASPRHQLQTGVKPFLGVCSTLRPDACPQAQAFAAEARRLGSRAEVLETPQSHRAINEQLGAPSTYTSQVEAFLASLDETLRERLAGR